MVTDIFSGALKTKYNKSNVHAFLTFEGSLDVGIITFFRCIQWSLSSELLNFGQFSVLATLKFMRFPAVIVLSSKKIILKYLQKLKSLDLHMTQDSSLRKV